ncbi:MAG TPA: Ger(x)C family spore germination protein [Candidatus Atribacteria bacterium]|nr:Ger(x)C family spore germination protein [Candidatus Atribacteria bacterium]
MKRLILVLVILTIPLAGCWDRVDIDMRGYVLGIALDAYPPNPIGQNTSELEASPEEEEPLEKMETQAGRPKYAMTVQLPMLKNSQTAGSGPTGGGFDGSSTWEITQIGDSFISMNREMATRTSLLMYYEHLQVIIISDEIARQGLEKVMDFFLRDPEMRRRVKIFISKGEAKRILDVLPRIEDYASMYLSLIPLNVKKTSRMATDTDLGELIINIHSGLDFVLPKVEAIKDEIKSSGGAAIKNGKMVGWLTELELEAVKLMRNLYRGGVITVRTPGEEEGLNVLEVTKAKSTIKPSIKDNVPHFDIRIKVEGNYAEDVNIHTHGQLDMEYIRMLERTFKKEIESLCTRTIKRMQEEYGADVLQLKRILQTKAPAYWKKIADQWDEIYPSASISITADVTVSLLGLET